MRKLALLMIVVAVVFVSSCDKIKRIKQRKEEAKELEFKSKMPRKDTLLLDFVIGWNYNQVQNHITNLKNNDIIYMDGLSKFFDIAIDQYGGEKLYKTNLFTKFNDDKLIGLEIFIEADRLDIWYVHRYLLKQGFRGAFFENYGDIKHIWFYSGSNLRVDIFESVQEEGVWCDMEDRFEKAD